jgi:phosphoribosylformylglycinamidine synthase
LASCPTRPGSLAASELAKLRGEALPDGLPAVDIDAVLAAQAAVRDAVRAGAITSAHDIAEGGLLVALAEACLGGGLGATLELDAPDEATLFGEAPGRFVVSGTPEALQACGARVLGTVGGDALDAGAFRVTLEDLRAAHGALATLFP